MKAKAKEKQIKKTSGGKRALKIILIVVCALLFLVAAFLGFLTVTQYNPDNVETLEIIHDGEAVNTSDTAVPLDTELSLLSWNTGYAALADHVDFFMDGGEMVNTYTEEDCIKNLTAMSDTIKEVSPDFLFVQEVDRASQRTGFTNEMPYYEDAIENSYSSFANNFKALYVPYPWPPIGTVDSGIMTVSSYSPESAERYQLPIPFSWPISTVNLKRCLLITRYPVQGSDKDLILINLHLEAYDDGEGKEAQTKMLCELMESFAEEGNYVIAGGDFNQIFSNIDSSSFPYKEGEWQAGEIDVSTFSDGFTFLMDDEVPSCRSLSSVLEGADKETFQYYIIDGFIVSDNIQIEEFYAMDLGFENTDHNPVYLKFSLKP